jgi:hypothetical protein
VALGLPLATKTHLWMRYELAKGRGEVMRWFELSPRPQTARQTCGGFGDSFWLVGSNAAEGTVVRVAPAGMPGLPWPRVALQRVLGRSLASTGLTAALRAPWGSWGSSVCLGHP